MSREISTIVTGMSYLEGPRWHDQRIWFSDFYTCRVYSAAEDGSDIRTEAEVPEQPSGLGWLPDGRLLIVSMRDGRLLRREADGTLACHAGDMWFPNGSVITQDGTLMVDETFGNRVTAFDITEDGTLANRRTWAKFGEPPSDSELGKLLAQVVVAPDGCGLDADGALWIADGLGARVIRVRRGGEITEEIQAGTGVFACMLGGADGRTLFICAAPDFQEEARKNAREATLRTARVDTPRAGLP